MKRGRKRKIRSRKPIQPFTKKPFNRCVLCLYQVGFNLPEISKMLRLKKENVGVIIFRANATRNPLRLAHRTFKKPQVEKKAAKLIAQQYRRENQLLKQQDESRHWWNHRARINWFGLEVSRKIQKARALKKQAAFKCQFCGCDITSIPQQNRKFLSKFCSDECRKKDRNRRASLRLETDLEFRRRKSEIRKRCRERIRRERPEVLKAEVRRKLANPQFRIARNHRARIYYLVRRGLMTKTQASLKYFGCTSEQLKQHLESQFKPGMTWENYGKVWHVDHKTPLGGKTFDLTNTRDCEIAFHWSNLQPLFAKENLRKSNHLGVFAPSR